MLKKKHHLNLFDSSYNFSCAEHFLTRTLTAKFQKLCKTSNFIILKPPDLNSNGQNLIKCILALHSAPDLNHNTSSLVRSWKTKSQKFRTYHFLFSIFIIFILHLLFWISLGFIILISFLKSVLNQISINFILYWIFWVFVTQQVRTAENFLRIRVLV